MVARAAVVNLLCLALFNSVPEIESARCCAAADRIKYWAEKWAVSNRFVEDEANALTQPSSRESSTPAVVQHVARLPAVLFTGREGGVGDGTADDGLILHPHDQVSSFPHLSQAVAVLRGEDDPLRRRCCVVR